MVLLIRQLPGKNLVSRPLRFGPDVRSVMKAAPALKLSWTLSTTSPAAALPIF